MGDGAEFAITRATSGEFLGAIGLRPIDWDRRTATAGYWVAAWARRQGVATRGLIMATRWAFHQVGLVAVELVTKIGNVASERVAEKAGFEMVGLDHEYVAAGQRFDVKRWELRPPRA
jgi:RimJ/RimL family protein N-acetyltransferase